VVRIALQRLGPAIVGLFLLALYFHQLRKLAHLSTLAIITIADIIELADGYHLREYVWRVPVQSYRPVAVNSAKDYGLCNANVRRSLALSR
jgi:hypothetical protein